MKLWVVALQEQGADVSSFLPVDDGLCERVFWNNLHRDGMPQEYTAAQLTEVCALIDRGYTILEVVQAELGSRSTASSTESSRTATPSCPDTEHTALAVQPWPNYKGNVGRTGYTGSPGPRVGECAWTFPVGLAWEAAPVVEGDRVYTASPGMRTNLHCLDLTTGEPLWSTRQVVDLMGDQLYNTPAVASTPVILRDSILVRQLGSRGNKGQARHVLRIDRASGRVVSSVPVGHVDYRAGYAPLAANDQYLVVPHGVQDIEATPPTAQGFNRILCFDTATGGRLWDFNIGPTFAEPVVRGNRAWIGTRSGYVYCLRLDGRFAPPSAERIAWQFRAGGAVNRAVAVEDHALVFGANDGVVYCLDPDTGRCRWRQRVCDAEPRAFRQFSTPRIAGDAVFVGGADRGLHCLDLLTGAIRFRVQADDWVRSRPAVVGAHVYFATLAGTVSAVRVADGMASVVWSVSAGRHPVYADIAVAEGSVVVNSSDLSTYCLEAANGAVRWQRHLLSGFACGQGRVHTEQIAGGAYFQSKPTAVDGKVFFGTPSRFVYALDADTGAEIWRFELGAAVSGAPEYGGGCIFIGQQGGESDFYCLNAETGVPVWSQAVGWVWGSACVDRGQVFVPEIEGWANCLDAVTGAIRWRYRTEKSLCTEPFVEGETVYFGGWDHYLYAFDRRDGALQWKFQLSGGADSGVPVVADGRIYLSIGGPVFRCLNADTAEVLWEFRRPRCSFNVSPAYHDGRVYVGVQRGMGLGGIPVDPRLYCLDATTGEVLWQHPGGGLTGAVVGGDGRVFIASTGSPFLDCLAREGNPDGTARLVWRYRMGNKVEESVPCLYGDRLYILSTDGFLHAVQ
jgi:outer membrane protein assembly factor BamB